MKVTLENIIEFVVDHTSIDQISQNTDIYNAGCYGDDWHELMKNYSEKFSVDMSNYVWYFHTSEEGSGSIGGVLFKPPNQRVERMKITPQDLFDMAIIGRWNIKYPNHSIPTKRYDLIINSLVLVIIIISLIILWFW